MSFRLPIGNLPRHRVGTTLQNIPFITDLHWNSREGAWYIDFLANDETPIEVGRKVVLGALLTLRKHDLLPDGEFIVSDSTDTGTEATLDDLGQRVNIYFFDIDEL